MHLSLSPPYIISSTDLIPLRSSSPASSRRKTVLRRSGMVAGWRSTMAVAFYLFSIIFEASPQPLIELTNERQMSDRFSQPSSLGHGALTKEDVFCGSWKFSVEANDAGMWTRVPERCVIFVRDYMTQGRYLSDLSFVARNSLDFAKSVKLIGDGKDAWVFDIDETLLSNFPYYESHGLGSEDFDEKAFNKWVDMAEAPALHSSLRLYREIRWLGFTVFLLTGRSEAQRNVTETNLLSVGYSHWKKLILRGADSKGKTATIYKSEKRKEIEDEGYTIYGNSGDQWSDLFGFSIAVRSFKLPNPMYFIA